MKVFLHHLETMVPDNAYSQEFLAEQLAAWMQHPRLARLVRQVFRRSGIEYRHSVLPDFLPNETALLYTQDANGRVRQPSTQVRNQCYQTASDQLAVELAQRALAHAQGFSIADITHVITVSCTGFYNPGPEYRIVTALGMAHTTQRYHLGFMGCYAAFPALRMAQQFCLAQPEAVVLVVCLELCSLHMQLRDDPDCLLANALFGDGAAAAIVSARPPSGDVPVYEFGRFESALAPEGKQAMAWEIGDSGFNLVLSSYVPEIIGANVACIVDDLLARDGRTRQDIDLWAVHPGGRAILDKIEQALDLSPHALDASRNILRRFGNLSSATVLFVLDHLRKTHGAAGGSVCTMAFGPGLVIESGLLQLVPSESPCPIAAEPVEQRPLAIA